MKWVIVCSFFGRNPEHHPRLCYLLSLLLWPKYLTKGMKEQWIWAHGLGSGFIMVRKGQRQGLRQLVVLCSQSGSRETSVPLYVAWDLSLWEVLCTHRGGLPSLGKPVWRHPPRYPPTFVSWLISKPNGQSWLATVGWPGDKCPPPWSRGLESQQDAHGSTLAIIILNT